jgi:hypothetical protein
MNLIIIMADSSTQITVFISYSHDSRSHNDRVLALANRLCKEGIDVSLDQYEQSPPQGWPQWMYQQIEKSNYVLIICSMNYLQKINGQTNKKSEGFGIKWESLLTLQDIYDNGSLNLRYIPVYFGDSSRDQIPKIFKGATSYQIETEYDKLYRHLTNQPAIIKPPIGKIKALSPKNNSEDIPFKIDSSQPLPNNPHEKIEKKIVCPVCNGHGKESSLSLNLCSVCHGKGKLKINYPVSSELKTCPVCNGRGKESYLSLNLCPVCHGVGKNIVDRTAEICPVCNGRGRESYLSLNLCPACNGIGYID